MPETIYLTSDQYVVKLLGESKNEIAKLNEKYDDLLARFVKQQNEIKNWNDFKTKFRLERTAADNGWGIYYGETGIVYQWDSSSGIDKNFQEMLTFLGWEMPKGENNEQ